MVDMKNILVNVNFLDNKKFRIGHILYIAFNTILFCKENSTKFDDNKLSKFLLNLNNLFKYSDIKHYSEALFKEIGLDDISIKDYLDYFEEDFINININFEIGEIVEKSINYEIIFLFYEKIWKMLVFSLIAVSKADYITEMVTEIFISQDDYGNLFSNKDEETMLEKSKRILYSLECLNIYNHMNYEILIIKNEIGKLDIINIVSV